MPKAAVRTGFGVVFIVLGALHFVRPGVYASVMPPYFAVPLFWVLLSGLCEILGGVGLLLKPYRRPAAYALALLMVAFFPVHVEMLINPASVGVAGVAPVLLFWRLALQFVLIAVFIWLAD